MATGTVVKSWKDSSNAHVAVRVAEGGDVTKGGMGDVEYVASTPLKKEDGGSKTLAELKADLTAAIKAKRDAQIAGPSDAGISGSVTL